MSRASDGTLVFGPWLPDVPADKNPGLLTANNVVWVDNAYRGYLYASPGSNNALAARPQGALSVLATDGTVYTYAGTATKLYVRNGIGWDDRTTGSYTLGASDFWRFVQFDNYVIGTSYTDVPQKLTIGSGSNFSALAVTGTAPKAKVIGVVGRFVVLGNINEGGTVTPYRIWWPRIDDPTEWPTLNSADALSKQSGDQLMPSKNGAVTGIVGNDQFGIVFQETGVSRMTYVGGDLVFQFDEIDGTRGCRMPNGIVQVGDLAYFISDSGLCVTDGVTVKPLSEGRFSQGLAALYASTYLHRIYGAFDEPRGLIYWFLPSGANSGRPNKVLIYNIKDDRATTADEDAEVVFQRLAQDTGWSRNSQIARLYCFDDAYKLSDFTGAAAPASQVPTIDTGEQEPNPGTYTRIQGIKPITSGQSIPGMSVALGYRSDYFVSPTYTSDTVPTSRTGFADFRVEARYIRARLKLGNGFTSTTGLEFQQVASGAV